MRLSRFRVRALSRDLRMCGLTTARMRRNVRLRNVVMSADSAIFDSVFFFSSRRRHTRFDCDWSSDVCSSDLHHSALAMPVQDQKKLNGIVLELHGWGNHAVWACELW